MNSKGVELNRGKRELSVNDVQVGVKAELDYARTILFIHICGLPIK